MNLLPQDLCKHVELGGACDDWTGDVVQRMTARQQTVVEDGSAERGQERCDAESNLAQDRNWGGGNFSRGIDDDQCRRDGDADYDQEELEDGRLMSAEDDAKDLCKQPLPKSALYSRRSCKTRRTMPETAPVTVTGALEATLTTPTTSSQLPGMMGVMHDDNRESKVVQDIYE
jgi:hypothetical protein